MSGYQSHRSPTWLLKWFVAPVTVGILFAATAVTYPITGESITQSYDLVLVLAVSIFAIAGVIFWAARPLRRAEERQRTLVEQLPLVTYVGSLTPGEPPLYVGPQLENLIGFAPAEYGSTRNIWVDVVHPDDRDRALADEFDRRKAEGTFSSEYRMLARDGRTVWVRDESMMVRDGKGDPVYLQGFLVDITSEKEAQVELAKAEARYRSLVERLPLISYVDRLDDVSSNIYSSPQIERVLGYSVEEWTSDPDLFVKILHPDDHDAALAQRPTRPGETAAAEYRVRARDGRLVWLRDESVVVQDDPGEPPRLEGFLVDLTERKVAEDRLRESEDRLRHAQKMEATGRLAGGIAHDFNNLLLAIRGYSELALADIDSSPGEAKRDLEQIKAASETAASLTGQLLAFSRKQVLQPRPLDLSRLVSDRMSLLRGLISEEIEVEMRLEPDVEPVRLDELQMEQALVNVIVNARDAMEGAGRLTIETANAGRHVRLSVTDTGTGMEEETRLQAFDPFFTTKGTMGTGLGLATVHGFVEQSEGHVLLESTPGSGTTVRFYFPAVKDRVAPEVPDAPLGADTAGLETVLLVEDEEAVRHVLRLTLEREGYTVLEAGDGEQALAVSAAHPAEIDVMVTDVVMPRMGGVETARKLFSARPGTRVVYMSGHLQDAESLQTVQEHGIFLQKPFAPIDLARKVRELVDGSA